MARIFISYSRQNRDQIEPFVDKLTRAFRTEGIFYDRHNAGGKPWWESILAHIAEADVFVYLVSNASLASFACRAEYLEAMRLGKHVVPVDIADDVDLSYTDPPLAFILAKLHRVHHTNWDQIVKDVTIGLHTPQPAYREAAQTFNMRDVRGDHVNIGGNTTYHINVIFGGDAPVAQPAPGNATVTKKLTPERLTSDTTGQAWEISRVHPHTRRQLIAHAMAWLPLFMLTFALRRLTYLWENWLGPGPAVRWSLFPLAALLFAGLSWAFLRLPHRRQYNRSLLALAAALAVGGSALYFVVARQLTIIGMPNDYTLVTLFVTSTFVIGVGAALVLPELDDDWTDQTSRFGLTIVLLTALAGSGAAGGFFSAKTNTVTGAIVTIVVFTVMYVGVVTVAHPITSRLRGVRLLRSPLVWGVSIALAAAYGYMLWWAWVVLS